MLYKKSEIFLKINMLQIIRINKYEIFISILKSILKRKNKYKVNGSVTINGTISFNKKTKKLVTYFFFIIPKKNENNIKETVKHRDR